MTKQPNIDHYCLDNEWLNHRMLFIAGPRQVGKTTYAQNKIKERGGAYFNWDSSEVRKAYSNQEGFFGRGLDPSSLVVFDEIHKIHKWKNILKGIYDGYKKQYQFMITGSARLDTFRRSGDSLVGRYFLTHLLPLSIGDLHSNNFAEFICADSLISSAADSPRYSEELAQLLSLGGFPEPFYKGSVKFWRHWQKQHQELLIQEDLRDLSNIVSINKIEEMLGLLETQVARPVSYNSIATALEVNHVSIKQWLIGLEKIMLVYRIKPWSKKITRSLQKSPKVYFYDWSFVSEPGARYENFVASQLMKACTLWRDRFALEFDLYFIRTYDDAEVDFLITLAGKPWLLIEAKHGNPDIPSALYRFSEELKVPAILVTNENGWNTKKNNIQILSADKLLGVLP